MSKPKRPLILGVDPGLSGACAILNGASRELVAIFDMPLSTKDDRENGGRGVDGYTLGTIIGQYANDIQCAIVELVGGMTYIHTDAQGRQSKRGQGSAESFAFGKSAGVAQGVIQGLLIPCHFVYPATWKSLMGLNSNKNLSRERARQQWKSHAAHFSRVKDDGRAEAALLALFGAQRFFRKT